MDIGDHGGSAEEALELPIGAGGGAGGRGVEGKVDVAERAVRAFAGDGKGGAVGAIFKPALILCGAGQSRGRLEEGGQAHGKPRPCRGMAPLAGKEQHSLPFFVRQG